MHFYTYDSKKPGQQIFSPNIQTAINLAPLFKLTLIFVIAQEQ